MAADEQLAKPRSYKNYSEFLVHEKCRLKVVDVDLVYAHRL